MHVLTQRRLSVHRYRDGLVRPRPVVAGAEHLAGSHAVHSRPVRRPGRRAAALHAHAQDAACSAARSAVPRLSRRLLCQDIQRCRQPVQGAR